MRCGFDNIMFVFDVRDWGVNVYCMGYYGGNDFFVFFLCIIFYDEVILVDI